MGILRLAGRGVGLALLCAAVSALAAPPPSPEYQVKAVLLMRIAQFVEWPPEAFGGPASPVVIAVLGDDPFGGYLDQAVEGQRIGERPMEVRRCRRLEDLGECQILFISGSEAGRIGGILERLKGRSLLTVGDTDGFNRDGGIVRFVTENNKIRLRIRVDAARDSGLTVSSKLLRLATIVGAQGN